MDWGLRIEGIIKIHFVHPDFGSGDVSPADSNLRSEQTNGAARGSAGDQVFTHQLMKGKQ